MRPAHIAALLLACAACADGAGGAARPPSVAVRDSAGVRIVENTGVARAPALGWRVDETPMLDLGTDAEPVLSRITGATRLADGRIVVASSGTQRLEVFDVDGRHVRSIGRKGSGPGEFRSIFHVARLAGDSLAAWDPLQGRLSIFGPGGEFVRTTTPAAVLSGPLPQVQGVLPDGRFIVAASAGGTLPAAGRAARDTAEWLLLGRSGAAAGRLGRFPGTEMIAHVDRGGMLLRPLPFGLSTATAVHGDALYVATGERYEVAVYGLDGRMRMAIRADAPRLPVAREDMAAYRRELVNLGGDAESRRREQALLEAAPYPESMPAVAGVKVDAEGSVWVQDTQRPASGAPQTWTVFGPDGILRGAVQLPPGLRVTEIGPDWVLGLALDANQGEHVRLYRLRRG